MSKQVLPHRMLTIAHSYCVALNRRLAHEMARIGEGRWEVTAVAPQYFQGDLRPVPLELCSDELCHLETVPVHFSKHIHVMLYGERLRQLMRGAWDVVHCWEEPFILAGGQIGSWARKRAVLVYVTAQNYRKKYPPPFNWIERRAMKRASGWIAFGQTIQNALLPTPAYAQCPRRIIPLGVDIDQFRPNLEARASVRYQLGWTEPKPLVIGFMGRFVKDKGLELLMRVLDHVSLPWRALFIGGGPMEKDLCDWGAQYGQRVKVLTGITHDEVPTYLNAMDVLCAPSQTMPNWREQFGRMLIEAFACGVPIIASDSGEIPYVVDHAGIIVGEKDEAGWIRAIEDLLGNEAQRHEFSKRGVNRSRSTFAWPVVAQQHLDFFDELLDMKGKTQH